MYTVYMHTAPNGKMYIGITSQKNVKVRWARGNGYKDSKHFYSAISKYGWDNMEHQVIEQGLTAEEAKAREIELIAMYDTTNSSKGYNRTIGGDTGMPLYGELNGMYGRGHTPETRAKQSAIAKERFKDKENHPMYGTHRTEETKKKLSIAHKGRCSGEANYFYGQHLTGEQAYAYGSKRTDESKKKISEARVGKYMGVDAYNSRKIHNIDTDEYFDCAMDVKRKYGYDNSSIGKCCKGLIESSYGCHWTYVTPV